MEVVREAGARPLLRAAGAGVVAVLLALYVQLWGLFRLLDPVAPEPAQVGAGALIVLVAATLGGVAGAWQAALAGVGTRRGIVLVGAASPAAACVIASSVLSVTESVDPGRAVLEVVVIVAGAAAGAWLLPAVARLLARLRGARGQTAGEYMGALLLVALIIAALVSVAPRIGAGVSGAIDAILGAGGQTEQQTTPPASADPMADDDGDGITNDEEAALGTNPAEADSDGDGSPDGDEFTQGTDPLQGIEPLTEDNFFKPWERVGITEDEWSSLEKAILDEINPGGWKGFLFGDAASGLILDENGELVLVPPGAVVYFEDGRLQIAEMQENGIGGGLVKGLSKILGLGGKTASAALKSALEKLPAGLKTRLVGAGVIRGADVAGATAKALPRFQPGSWLPHFEKHAAEFGFRTPVEYLKGARDLVGRPGIQTFTRGNGDKLFYDAARNEFAVMRPDGVLRTYFRPQNGSRYWTSQTGG